jgi:hypothetical protein
VGGLACKPIRRGSAVSQPLTYFAPEALIAGSELPCMVAGLPFANGSYGLWIAALRDRQQLAAFGRFPPVVITACAGQVECKRLVSTNAIDWSVAMQLGGQVRCHNAEPMRVGMRSLPARVGLVEEAPRARLATATVATSVAMLQTRYYAGCRRCRRCRQINHHSIWRVILGYQRRPVSAHRIGTTLWSLV